MSVLEEAAPSLRVVVVDDEAPARSELAYLLRQRPADRLRALRRQRRRGAARWPRPSRSTPSSATCGCRAWTASSWPGCCAASPTARRSSSSPPTTSTPSTPSSCARSTTCMKPVRADRLAEAVRRLCPAPDTAPADADETSRWSSAGVTRFVRRSEVRFVEAQGDYARLHTADGQPPGADVPGRAGAAVAATSSAIHRSTLVALAHVEELRMDDGRCTRPPRRRRAA